MRKQLLHSISFAILLVMVVPNVQGATSEHYKIENIDNPPSRFGTKQIDGMDFLPDGRLAVCMPSGEVFFYDLKKKTWHLFAQGLHNPLGIVAIANNELVIAQRPELTRVKDTDGDGKADLYEAMTEQFGMSGNYHEFNFTPVRDKDGAFYFGLGTASSGNGVRTIVRGKFDPRGRPGRMHASTPYRGWILKYTADGKTIPWTSGHRSPNGLGFDLEGNLFVTDNQGDWVGTSKLFHLQKGNFYGHVASLTWRKGFTGTPLRTPAAELDKLRTRACVVFPHGSMANSPTQVLAITPEAKFGPFTGQLLVGEMNKSRIMRVMLEKIDGQLQGACVPFIDGKPLRPGNNRFAWAPDGSLYVGHTRHTWAGNEGLQRVSWNGKTPFEVHSMNLTKTGFRFTFTKPVDKTTVSPKTFPFKRYYYEYHSGYGSKQYDVTEVPVKDLRISDDGKVIEVDLAELKAWHIHELLIKDLKDTEGVKLSNNFLVYTLNRLLENTPPVPPQYSGGGGGKAKAGKNSPTRKPIPAKDVKGDVYEAEDAARFGPSIATNNRGFTGTGFADFGDGDQAIEWKVQIKQAGDHELTFRYALGSGSRPLKLVIDGKTVAEKIDFKSTGNWINWQDHTITVKFATGAHSIRLETTGKSGANFDRISIYKPK